MRQRTLLIVLALLLPVAYLAGRLADGGGGSPAGPGDRQVLHWVDPMNPAFRSPEPGIAPCGMPLEPVYAGGSPSGAPGSASPGAVVVRPDRVQLIGVAREQVRQRTVRHTLRLVGTVAPDETRLYAISAASQGRALELGPATTGSLVSRGQILGAYYSQELIVPQQNFVRLYEATASLRRTGVNKYDNLQGGAQVANYERNLHFARQALLNLGMSVEQIEELASRREISYMVQIRAPAAGFVLERRLTLGQSFNAGDQLFRIADLESVWILADALAGEERLFTPGMRATVTVPGTGQAFPAAVGRVLPQFAAATRTLKVRLEARNPGFALRPDMFVDVELPLEAGPGFFLPKEAVLDSGKRQTVFVEQEPGVFVPRTVRTGRRFGESVEIVAGLMEGETVVTSGNFLLDSESRMRAAGATTGAAALDPICGMEVEEATARARGLVIGHEGTSWFFCSLGCRAAFERNPAAAAAKALGAPQPAPALTEPGSTDIHRRERSHLDAAPQGTPAADPDLGPAGGPAGWQSPLPVPHDPVCGMEIDVAAALAAGLTSEHGSKTFYFCSIACRKEFDEDPTVFIQTGR